MTDPRFRLAPVVLVRAAAWPIEAMAPFGNAARLEELAAAATGEEPDAWRRCADLHEETLAAERSALKRATVDDRRFRKALELSNPSLAERASGTELAGARTKQIRGLEVALYRYLARAAGRTEPCDLWAGVVQARWGVRTEVRAAPARLRISPDLRPFQAMLQQLARLPAYRSRARWRANPTLDRQPDGRWLFRVRRPGGEVIPRRLGHDAAADAILRALLPLPPLTPSGLCRALARRPELAGIDIPQALDAMIEAGMLVGGLDLPPRFATPWRALATAGRLLRGREHDAWRAGVGRLRTICSTLEQRYEDLEPGAVRRALRSARAAVERLARRFGVAPDRLPRAVLRCDLRLPFRIVLGHAERDAVLAALQAYDEMSDSWSLGDALLRASAERLARSLGADGRPLVSAEDGGPRRPWLRWSQVAGGSPDADLEERIRRWERLLSAEGEETVLPAGGADAERSNSRPPLGTFLVSPIARSGRLAADLVVGGVVDDVAAPCARFGPLFGRARSSAGPGDLFFPWLRSALHELAARHGVEVAELLAPCEENPSVLTRPPLAPHAVEIWGASPGATSLAGATLYRDRKTGRFFLRLPGGARRLAVFWFPAAEVDRDDPLTRLVLRTSFHDTPLGYGPARVPCFDAEMNAPGFSPRVTLACGAVVRLRRTVLAGETLETLARLRGVERYVFWQGLARRHAWPRLVGVRRDGGPALLVPRSSPLAVDALCRGLAGAAKMLTVEEVPGPPWLADAEGGHHSVELAVPFARTRHAWSPLEPADEE